MTNGVADHAINARPRGNSVGAIGVAQGFEWHLARRRRRADGGISKCAALAQSKDPERERRVSHRHHNPVSLPPNKGKHAQSVTEVLGLSGNFYGIGAPALEASDQAS